MAENCRFSLRLQFEWCWSVCSVVNEKSSSAESSWAIKSSHSLTSSWTLIRIVPSLIRRKFSSECRSVRNQRNNGQEIQLFDWGMSMTFQFKYLSSLRSLLFNILRARVYKKFRNLSPDLVPLDMTSPESPKIRIPKERIVRLAEFVENPWVMECLRPWKEVDKSIWIWTKHNIFL